MANDNPSTPSIARPPCSPSELRRLKVSCWIVLALCAVFFAMVFTFGDAPRSIVNRMNMFLGPVVVIALAICAYALWRFRKACAAWRQENDA